MKGPPKLFFVSQTKDNFENVYKPEKVATG
jgi:hypothetical protein